MKQWIFSVALIAMAYCEAQIKLIEFKNESDLKFHTTFCNGTPVEGSAIDQSEACITTEDLELRMVFEDAGRSGYHRPEWKFHLWLERDDGFPFFHQDRILYAVIFYDGDGEVSIHWDKDGKLHVYGGLGVKDILYPWSKGRPVEEIFESTRS